MFGVVPLICAKKSFINQADAKGEWGWGGGGGGRRTGFKFKGLLRYQKPHVTDNISIYAFAYNVQYADSLYCCLYSNIRYNIQCRITNFLHCELLARPVHFWLPKLYRGGTLLARPVHFWRPKVYRGGSLVPRPRSPTAAGGLHHRYVESGHFPRSGDVIHPQLLGIWVWGRDYRGGTNLVTKNVPPGTIFALYNFCVTVPLHC